MFLYSSDAGFNDNFLAYASTAQSVGQNIGYFAGFSVFLGAQSFGWISLGQFLAFWGAAFIAASLLLVLFAVLLARRQSTARRQGADGKRAAHPYA